MKGNQENNNKNENSLNQLSYTNNINNDNIILKNLVSEVYILKTVFNQMIDHCKKEIPNEALGVLIGRKLIYQGIKYTKIVDIVFNDRVDSSPISAQFTMEGIMDYQLTLNERYGKDSEVTICGLYHSHPFHVEPHFSSLDLDTFLRFPYATEGNVFFLIEPSLDICKCFIIRVVGEKGNKKDKITLQQTDFIIYEPRYQL